MKSIGRKANGLFIFLLLSLSLFSYSNPAHASVMSDLSAGVTNVVRFITHDFVAQIRNSFCDLYLSQITSGVWKDGSPQANFGKNLCANYKPIVASESIGTKIAVRKDNGNLAIPNKPESLSHEANTPGAYVGDVTAEGTSLNAGQIIYWTNIQRQSNGTNLSSLGEDSTLNQIAMARVQDLFAKQYFEHVSPTGGNISTLLDGVGYEYIAVGENLALGNYENDEALVQAWMDSPGHRANILNGRFQEIGVAVERGTFEGHKTWLAVQAFALPLSACPQPDTSLKAQINLIELEIAELKIKADVILEELESYRQKGNRDAYNQKVKEYNTLVEQINNLVAQLKTLVAQYNAQVATFNSCTTQQ